jgi:Mn2+/Fe2+ NRAMP family transporter
MNDKSSKPSLRGRWFRAIGPGVITGAANDDPSAVTTYSIAGAQFGTAFLWTSLFTWPLLAVAQMMCARIGMVTGRGLVGALKQKFPKPVLLIVCVALFAANTLNLGADLSGMAEVSEMMTGIDARIFVVLFGVSIAWATAKFHYEKIVAILKWLCLFLFAYLVTAVMVVEDWPAILKATITPSLPRGENGWRTLVAIIGTVMSPYVFFWQSSQEVEEEKSRGRKDVKAREGVTINETDQRKLDVGIGSFFSRLVMFFIIVTTALTLHPRNIQIETSRQAAEALEPLAGPFAAVLYTLGLLGVGFLVVPVLSGSAAYALAELFSWRQGLDKTPVSAKRFYAIIAASTLLGIVISLVGISPVKALLWAATVNGVLAPFLLLGVVAVAGDSKIMLNQQSTKVSRVIVILTSVAMLLATAAMFIF